jgi:assimilatory nitrate reductase catalytic subunit
MGFGKAFAWRRPADVFREYAALTRFENDGARPLNLGPLSELDDIAYDRLEPVQWPIGPGGGTARLFTDGQFATPDGRAWMRPLKALGPARTPDADYPMSLNTGRVRDHWHTMTRTGLAPELCRHAPEPVVAVHPADGVRFGLTDGELARVETREGVAVVTARFSDRQRPGGVFLPMHWTDAFAPQGRCNPLVEAAVDPVSGQPEFKHTPARISAYGETWRGFFVAGEAFAAPTGFDLVWRRTPFEGCQVHEFAGLGGAEERAAVAEALMSGAEGEMLAMDDPARGALRRAVLRDGRPERVLVMTEMGGLPARGWIADRFLDDALSLTDRAVLLAGRAPGARDEGRIVCACLRVGTKTLTAAIRAGAVSLDAVGEATGAGTNCGSCRPEIAGLIRIASQQEGRRHAV